MRFLCISDVHGDADALRQVLAAGQVKGFDQLVVLGDLLFPGPKPLETWKLLLEHKALCVQGISDRALATVDPNDLEATTDEEKARLSRLYAMHEELGDLIIARLGKLPDTARIPLENGQEMVLVHGAPADPSMPMSHDLDDEELNALIGDDPADIVVCGASHVPFERIVQDVHVVNVGSVGERPTQNIAYATIIESLPTASTIEQFIVELD